MKLSAQEEYGLRCLLLLARCGEGESLTIPEISRAEGLSVPNVAKMMRLLRLRGLVRSARGQTGGYMLARPPEDTTLRRVLERLGGPIFGPHFCSRFSGTNRACVRAHDCSLRAVWSGIQGFAAAVLDNTTLKDLVSSEAEMCQRIQIMAGPLFTVSPRTPPRGRIRARA